jgi:hypothetical protein
MSPLPTMNHCASWLLPGVAGAWSVPGARHGDDGGCIRAHPGEAGRHCDPRCVAELLLVWMTKKLSTQLDTQTTATQAGGGAESSVKDALEDMRLEMRGLR